MTYPPRFYDKKIPSIGIEGIDTFYLKSAILVAFQIIVCALTDYPAHSWTSLFRGISSVQIAFSKELMFILKLELYRVD